MADRISEDEIAMLMRAFNKHDTDGDGVVDVTELAALTVLREWRPSS